MYSIYCLKHEGVCVDGAHDCFEELLLPELPALDSIHTASAQHTHSSLTLHSLPSSTFSASSKLQYVTFTENNNRITPSQGEKKKKK